MPALGCANLGLGLEGKFWISPWEQAKNSVRELVGAGGSHSRRRILQEIEKLLRSFPELPWCQNSDWLDA